MCKANISLPDTIAPTTLAHQLVMIIHGWLGSFQLTTLLPLRTHCIKPAFMWPGLTLRDHGNTADLNKGLFHSAMTDEVVAAAQFVMNDFQRSEAGLVGFSWAATLR